MMMMSDDLFQHATELLRTLISIPSPSREEKGTADALESFLAGRGVAAHRERHNVWAFNKHFNPRKPTILLNSHHDTVKPNTGYTRNPFSPDVADGKLYGLGSNSNPLVPEISSSAVAAIQKL